MGQHAGVIRGTPPARFESQTVSTIRGGAWIETPTIVNMFPVMTLCHYIQSTHAHTCKYVSSKEHLHSHPHTHHICKTQTRQNAHTTHTHAQHTHLSQAHSRMLTPSRCHHRHRMRHRFCQTARHHIRDNWCRRLHRRHRYRSSWLVEA